MTASRRLRMSSSLRAASASPRRMPGDGVRAGVARLDRRRRVVDRDAADPQRLRAVEVRPARDPVEAAQVEVVDDLLDEVADVLDERHARLDVAGHAEPAEHLLAEAVGGGDRGAVEVGQRVREPPPAQLDLLAARRRTSSRTTSSRSGGAPASARASPCSALTSRSRTRSRSSPVAIRVNVTSSSLSSGMPSAT